MSNESKGKAVVTLPVEECIYFIRGQKVMLDEDLAKLYGVTTKRLNEQVKRNIDRFPEDFMFQLAEEELNLRSQNATSSLTNALRSQNATLKGSYGGRRYLPFAFTEQGVAMLSSVLRIKQAIAVNIHIMRAFVKMRHVFASQEKLSKEMESLRAFVLKESQGNRQEVRKIWATIEKLMKAEEPKNERRIGFDLEKYRKK